MNFKFEKEVTDIGTHIIAGHYGSGKTEFAVNYALRLHEQGRSVAIADLDIANPYFRVREKADELEAQGIHVVSNNLHNEWRIDIPALSAELESFFTDNDRENVVDVGGNAEGARVLGRFSEFLRHITPDFWLVINANRYESQTPEEVIAFARQIEAASGVRFTALINNTHMLRETAMEDILRGAEVTRVCSQRLHLPCIYTVCPAGLYEECRGRQAEIPGELFPIELHMRPDYL